MASPKIIYLGCLVLLLAMIEATPPGIANHPAQASCKIKKYKMCYNLVLACPKFCPDACEVECASCKPICTSVSSSSSSSSSFGGETELLPLYVQDSSDSFGGDTGSSPPEYVSRRSDLEGGDDKSEGDDDKGEGGHDKGEGDGDKGKGDDEKGKGDDYKGKGGGEKGKGDDDKGKEDGEKGKGDDDKGKEDGEKGKGDDDKGKGDDDKGKEDGEKGKGDDDKGKDDGEKGKGDGRKGDSPPLPAIDPIPPTYSPPTVPSSPPYPHVDPSPPTYSPPAVPSSPAPSTPSYSPPPPTASPPPPTPYVPTIPPSSPSPTPPTPSPPSQTPPTPTPSSPPYWPPPPVTPPTPTSSPPPPSPATPTPTPTTPSLSTPTPYPPSTPPPSPTTPSPVTPTPSPPSTPTPSPTTPSPVTPTPSTPPSSPYPTPSVPWPSPPTTPSTPTPPPSSGVDARKRVRCRNKGYGACYGQEFTCLANCPTSCQVDCNSCKPVCSCDYPGAVCQDPRFIGGDGITFYFHGKKDKDFCLVSDSNLHINAHFIGKRNPEMTRDFTWVQSISILFDNHRLYVGAQPTAAWNPAVDRLSLALDNEPIFLPETTHFKWQSTSTTRQITITRTSDSNDVVIEIEGKMTITAKVVPITEEESRVHNYAITKDDCFAHLDLGFKFNSLSKGVDGVLGKTYRDDYVSKVKMGVAMPIMGGDKEYSTSNLFATDCLVSRFNNGGQEWGALESLEFNSSTNCGSGMSGEGVVCKR